MSLIATDVPSYVVKYVFSILAAVEEEKKRKYGAAVEACHESFTPLNFVVSVDGTHVGETALFLCNPADGCLWTGVSHIVWC